MLFGMILEIVRKKLVHCLQGEISIDLTSHVARNPYTFFYPCKGVKCSPLLHLNRLAERIDLRFPRPPDEHNRRL